MSDIGPDSPPRVPTPEARRRALKKVALRLLVPFVVAFVVVCCFRPGATALLLWGLGLAYGYLLAVLFVRKVLAAAAVLAVPERDVRMRVVHNIRYGRLEADENLRAIQITEAQRWTRHGSTQTSVMTGLVVLMWALIGFWYQYPGSLERWLTIVAAVGLTLLTLSTYVNLRGARKILRDAAGMG